MKKLALILVFALLLGCFGGCTKIVKMEPTSGPPGTPVWVQTSGLWGTPGDYQLQLDGETILDSFPGSFTIPSDVKPGEHTITLVDNLDKAEATLIFPIFRSRKDSAIFTVVEP